MASKRKRDAPRPVPPVPDRPAGRREPIRSLVDVWAVERVPEGAEFTGVLRTPHAAPFMAIAGVVLGVLSFFAFTPILTQALVGAYWFAIGRPGPFADTYRSLIAFEHPWGMASAQLGIALLIPISAALMLMMHHVRPAYLFSVRPGMRWGPFFAFLGVAFVTMNGVLWIQNAITGKGALTGPQPGFVGFLVAILLTSPLQAAAEEVFFRGYLLQGLGSLSTSRWFGILASALVFALFHGTQNAWLFASRFAFGVLAAVLVVYIGGLEAGIAAHIVNNVCAFVYAGLSTGIAQLRATTTVTPVEAVGEVVMYAVFTAAALLVARRLQLATRTHAG